MTLLLALVRFGAYGAMCFVHNHKIRAVQQKQMLVAVALEEVDARHLHRIITIDAVGPRFTTLQLPNGAGANHGSFKVEFLSDLSLPLIAQVRRAEYT